VSADRTDCGRRFHTSGPAVEKARLRNFVLKRGTMTSDLAADRSCCRPGLLATGAMMSFMYSLHVSICHDDHMALWRLLLLLGPPIAITQCVSPYVLPLFLSFFLFYSVRDLCGLSADRRKTLPHDRKWVKFSKLCPKNGGPPPKFGAKKTCFLVRFRTTSHFDHKYLRNRTIYRQSENGVANYDLFHVC